MCGIAGILNIRESSPIEEGVLVKMLSTLRHRGPDESEIYMDPDIGLGNVRLSIIGLDDGTQPIGNEDDTMWIVFNGEAFNYLELKQELVQKGHTFTTKTDTEVVLHLYEEFGPSCVDKINGQFAIAIWNARTKELFLARDRLGIRPLYYTSTGNRFIFASEIKAVFQDANVRRLIDIEALNEVFTFWTTLTSKTIFQQVREVPPGHFLLIKDGRISQREYWSIPYYPAEQRWGHSFEEAKEELFSLLKSAVELRLRADVPVGAYLSGGLDSAIVTALISNYFNNRLKTFSMGFQEDRFDESRFQNELVRHLGTEHCKLSITNGQIRDHFSDTVWHCEKPILRTAPVPLYLLSDLALTNQFKVVLTGEGADEVFGGYNIFKEAKVRSFWGRSPDSKLRPLLLERLYPYIFDNPARGRAFLKSFYSVKPEDLGSPIFSHMIRWQNTGKIRSFLSGGLQAALDQHQAIDEVVANLPAQFSSRDLLSKAQFLEMAIFLSNYLLSSQGDRVAMAHSLEIRLPFLDYRVVDFAARLPPHWKIKGMNEKYILKKSFGHLLPESISSRVKQPYRAPIREAFFARSHSDELDYVLSDHYLNKTGYFTPQKVRGLLAKLNNPNLSSPAEVQNMAYLGILSTQLVHYQFIDNFSNKNTKPILLDRRLCL